MALERPGQDLGALDAEVRPAVLDRGNRGLGDARQLRQLALAELLELAKNADGLADGDLDTRFGWLKLLPVTASNIGWRGALPDVRCLRSEEVAGRSPYAAWPTYPPDQCSAGNAFGTEYL